MADAPAGSAQITGNVPFYKNPQPLSTEKHAALGIKRSQQPYGFARGAHVVPLTVGEFGNAALCYPIIYAGENKAPLAVMGLRDGENLFINDDGRIDDGQYVPAFVRRYPFVFAENGEQGLVVCIDEGSDLVSQQPDIPFFSGTEASQYTKDAIEFLKNFEQQRQLTTKLSEVLIELDLFEPKSVTYQPRDPQGGLQEPVKLADYYAISLERLNNVSAQKIVEMRDNGALAAIYAHNLSLLNWQRIIERAMKASAAAAQAAPVN